MNVFGFFSRKPQQPPEAVPLPPSSSASAANLSPAKAEKKNVQLRTPSPSVESASAAPAQPRSSSPTTKLARLSVEDSARQSSPTRRGSITGISAIVPNPEFVPPEPTVDSLTTHIASIPPKILHSYVLARIPSQPEETLPTLASFFSELAPPPKLHCVRCHKDYVEVENDDRSCLVPHDDESAEVERVGTTIRANRAPGTVGATYETLWGCCGKIVEGDGDQGPPDGWCYEGKHTTDIKRARFRADSTPQDDKLVSCLRLNCHGIRSQLPRGMRPTRKRPRSANYKEASTDEDQSEGGSDSGMDEIVGKPARARKPREKGKRKAAAEDAEQMDVDDEHAGESASVAGSASAPKRGRAPKSRNQAQAPSSVAKRRVRMAESSSKVIPGTDGEDDDTQSIKSAPAGPTPKRRGRAPKSKPVISDSDREMEADGTPAGRKEKVPAAGAVGSSGSVKPRTRSLSRTRVGEASEANAGVRPRSRARKVKEANAREREGEEGIAGGEEKPKKRRKVNA
ncbi:hypothetical protein BD414DRAFT_451205 [Trametes punicea]|nr:hypothetical protein BD414DRAFT_451205 [Trametes punicea]